MSRFRTLSGKTARVALIAAVAAMGATGCGDDVTATGLNPAGPPMVRQVFLTERVTNASGTGLNKNNQLAFGDHAEATDGDDRVVENAVPLKQRIRVVIDELLLGNNLEEIACKDGSWSKVPVGATPDDVARCADLDLTRCTGELATCVGNGGPVGVLDDDVNGSPDKLRFIENAVTLRCDDTDIPIDRELSFWQPSGNQQVPSGAGLNGIGPAVILIPREGLRTSARCTVVFAADVVDKDGERVCAPTDGDIGQDCAPGDTSKIDFGSEALRLAGSNPTDNANNVALVTGGSDEFKMSLEWNANLFSPGLTPDEFESMIGDLMAGVGAATTIVADPLPEGGDDEVTLTANFGDDPVAGEFTPEMVLEDPFKLTVRVGGGFIDNAIYTVTLGTGIADQYGSGLPENHVLTFCTGTTEGCGGGELPDAGVDAAVDAATAVDAGPADATPPDAL